LASHRSSFTEGVLDSRFGGGSALLNWIVVMTIGTVPINAADMKWDASDPTDPTDDWISQVVRRERLNSARTWIAVSTISSFVVALGIRSG
jgi:hypothetical protein